MPSVAVSTLSEESSAAAPGSADCISGSDDPPQPRPVPDPVEIDVRPAPGLERATDTSWIATHVRQAAEMLAREEQLPIACLSVAIVDDARMTRLHEQYTGIAKTTDVLTFDLREGRQPPLEVDIVICVDEAARRAAELGHRPERELLLYAIHGLLHCMGYDDHDEANWQRMHDREDQVLAALGVGATFHAQRSRESIESDRQGGARP